MNRASRLGPTGHPLVEGLLRPLPCAFWQERRARARIVVTVLNTLSTRPPWSIFNFLPQPHRQLDHQLLCHSAWSDAEQAQDTAVRG